MLDLILIIAEIKIYLIYKYKFCKPSLKGNCYKVDNKYMLYVLNKQIKDYIFVVEIILNKHSL